MPLSPRMLLEGHWVQATFISATTCWRSNGSGAKGPSSGLRLSESQEAAGTLGGRGAFDRLLSTANRPAQASALQAPDSTTQ